MFEIYNISTGQIIEFTDYVETADQIVLDLTNEDMDGHEFAWREAYIPAAWQNA